MTTSTEVSIPIERQMTRLVVPFYFSQDWDKAIAALSREKVVNRQNEEKPMWAKESIPLEHLFQNIETLVDSSDDLDKPIGKRFVLQDVARKSYGLPSSGNMMSINFANGGKNKENQENHANDFAVAFSSIELFLFETNVGILVFDLKYPKAITLDKLIESSYYCKKLNFNMTLTFRGENGIRSLDLDELCLNLLRDLGSVEFFEKSRKINSKDKDDPDKAEHAQENTNPTPTNALVFSAVLLGENFTSHANWQELLKRKLFHLRRSFKESYQPAEQEFHLENNPEITQMFANSYWGVSLEGIANVVHLVENETTNAFFRNNYWNNIGTTYFYMYILAVHQRYALLGLMIKASRSNSKTLSSEDIGKMRQDIASFIFRCLFRQVSNVTHQAKLYRMICDVFGIEDLLHELHFELEVLSSLDESEQNKRRAQERAEDEKRKEARAERKTRQDKRENYLKNILSVITACFLGISTSNSILGIFYNWVSRWIPQYFKAIMVIVLILVWTGLISITIFIISVINQGNKEENV